MFQTSETYVYCWNIINIPLLLIAASILTGMIFLLMANQLFRNYSYNLLISI